MSLASDVIDRSEAQSAHSRPLDSFFAPKSIAIIGASPDTKKIRGLLQSMLQKNGYPGRLYPVNPSYQEIADVLCFPSVGAPFAAPPRMTMPAPF